MNGIIAVLLTSFDEGERKQVEKRIVETRDFDPWKNWDQIWASIILLSDGLLSGFEEVLSDARRDWRDVVIASGLAVDDWESLVMKWVTERNLESSD